MAPLARSEMNVLKLERYPLRILLPEREIRRRGVGRGGDTCHILAHEPANFSHAYLLNFRMSTYLIFASLLTPFSHAYLLNFRILACWIFAPPAKFWRPY